MFVNIYSKISQTPTSALSQASLLLTCHSRSLQLELRLLALAT